MTRIALILGLIFLLHDAYSAEVELRTTLGAYDDAARQAAEVINHLRATCGPMV